MNPICLINGYGELVGLPALNELPLLRNAGVAYHVVGVFGAQSSGKSTLLNELFGTSFVTLADNAARGRTTQGAFVSVANTDHSLIVLDFEGTDGSERGDDCTFERQLCLFAMSVADVLIINMWATDVGRFNAANLSLLRTVFEVRLQLSLHDVVDSQPPRRVTLAFVLRDHPHDVERSVLRVTRDLFALWDGMNKPIEFKDKCMEDFFSLRFVGLPHYEFQRDEFNASVVALRNRFRSNSNESLLPSSTMVHDVPLESLPQYVSQCWEVIRTNKDLDLPSQRHIIAEFRCNIVMVAVAEKFSEACRQATESMNSFLCAPIQRELEHQMNNAMIEFDSATALYVPSIVMKHRDLLLKSLQQVLEDVVDKQASALASQEFRAWESRLSKVVDEAVASIAAQLSVLPQKASNVIIMSFWSQMRKQCLALQTEWEASLEGLLESDGELRAKVSMRITALSIEFLRRRMGSMTTEINYTMNRVFERIMQCDPTGQYRASLSSEQELRSLIGQGRYAGYVTLACFQIWRFHSNWELQSMPFLSVPQAAATDDQALPTECDLKGVPDACVMIPNASLSHITAMFRQHVEHTYTMKLAALQGSMNIPWWMWVLLLVFGFDEIMFIVTNPALLILLCTVAYLFGGPMIAKAYQRYKGSLPPGVVALISFALQSTLPVESPSPIQKKSSNNREEKLD